MNIESLQVPVYPSGLTPEVFGLDDPEAAGNGETSSGGPTNPEEEYDPSIPRPQKYIEHNGSLHELHYDKDGNEIIGLEFMDLGAEGREAYQKALSGEVSLWVSEGNQRNEDGTTTKLRSELIFELIEHKDGRAVIEVTPNQLPDEEDDEEKDENDDSDRSDYTQSDNETSGDSTDIAKKPKETPDAKSSSSVPTDSKESEREVGTTSIADKLLLHRLRQAVTDALAAKLDSDTDTKKRSNDAFRFSETAEPASSDDKMNGNSDATKEAPTILVETETQDSGSSYVISSQLSVEIGTVTDATAVPARSMPAETTTTASATATKTEQPFSRSPIIVASVARPIGTTDQQRETTTKHVEQPKIPVSASQDLLHLASDSATTEIITDTNVTDETEQVSPVKIDLAQQAKTHLQADQLPLEVIHPVPIEQQPVHTSTALESQAVATKPLVASGAKINLTPRERRIPDSVEALMDRASVIPTVPETSHKTIKEPTVPLAMPIETTKTQPAQTTAEVVVDIRKNSVDTKEHTIYRKKTNTEIVTKRASKNVARTEKFASPPVHRGTVHKQIKPEQKTRALNVVGETTEPHTVPSIKFSETASKPAIQEAPKASNRDVLTPSAEPFEMNYQPDESRPRPTSNAKNSIHQFSLNSIRTAINNRPRATSTKSPVVTLERHTDGLPRERIHGHANTHNYFSNPAYQSDNAWSDNHDMVIRTTLEQKRPSEPYAPGISRVAASSRYAMVGEL